MKLKKPMKIKAPGGAPGGSSGGATIADRFRLDVDDAKGGGQESGGSKAMTAIALVAAVAAFSAAAGLLALLNSHLGFMTGEV